MLPFYSLNWHKIKTNQCVALTANSLYAYWNTSKEVIYEWCLLHVITSTSWSLFAQKSWVSRSSLTMAASAASLESFSILLDCTVRNVRTETCIQEVQIKPISFSVYICTNKCLRRIHIHSKCCDFSLSWLLTIVAIYHRRHRELWHCCLVCWEM